jgi:ribonuclease D
MDAATMARYDVLHDWRKARAMERGVESDVIIPKEALWALARNAPGSALDLDNIPGLGPWKKEKYGSELLRLLASVAQQDA